jgi:hypothetical protein
MKYIVNSTKIIHADSLEEARLIHKIFYGTAISTIELVSDKQQPTFW